MFNKVQTKKVYMEIVEQVRVLIKEGRLKPGDKLPPEQVLAEEFGASRPSVREAMSALEILGIIERRGGKGNFIKYNFNFLLYEQKFRELGEEAIPFELLEAIKALEPEIVGLAAKKATEEEIATLQGSLNKMKDAAVTNIPEIMEFDREFHINIARAAHNSLLFSMMIYLIDLSQEKLWINMKEKSLCIPGHIQKYFEEHNEILKAIKNKDSKGARDRMHEHYTMSNEG